MSGQERKALRTAAVAAFQVSTGHDIDATETSKFRAEYDSRAALAAHELDGDGNPLDWKAEYEKLLSDEAERAMRLHERLAGMLGVPAFPIGPGNLTGVLLDTIADRLAAREEPRPTTELREWTIIEAIQGEPMVKVGSGPNPHGEEVRVREVAEESISTGVSDA